MAYSKEKLNKLYKSGGYDYLCSDNFKVIYEYVRSAFFANDSRSILDIGCWDGMFYRALRESEYKYSYLGFDLCNEAIRVASKKYGNKKTKFLNHNWNNGPIDGDFDAIYFGGVLYYIDDKVGFVKRFIEKNNPKIVAIQDLQQTDLDCFDKEFETSTKGFYVDLNVNEARKKRQVKIIVL